MTRYLKDENASLSFFFNDGASADDFGVIAVQSDSLADAWDMLESDGRKSGYEVEKYALDRIERDGQRLGEEECARLQDEFWAGRQATPAPT